MKLKIIPNPDKEKFDEMTKAVKENEGYCPCELFKNPDTKCLCKVFREQNVPGFCHCKRYTKVEIPEK